ncbi:unnamed protein product [Ascophyllum nodosum]
MENTTRRNPSNELIKNQSPPLTGPPSSGAKSRTKTYPRPNTRHKKRSKKAASPSDSSSPGTTWKPQQVKRCALQTLGGSTSNSSPVPLKGNLKFKRSSEATLRKMKSYGGRMFFDKCYLSSEDEKQHVQTAWTLSPSDGEESEPPRSTEDVAAASSSSKKGAMGAKVGDGKRAARRANSENPFAIPSVAEEDSCDFNIDPAEEDEKSEWMDTKASKDMCKPVHYQVHQAFAPNLRGGQRKATSTPGEAGKRPSRNKGENIADAFQGGTSKSTPSVTKSGGVGGNPIRQSATRKVVYLNGQGRGDGVMDPTAQGMGFAHATREARFIDSSEAVITIPNCYVVGR